MLAVACSPGSTFGGGSAADARAPDRRPAQGCSAGAEVLCACLPACIVDLYAGCATEGSCQAETHGATTALCYANGVKVLHEQRPDGSIAWETFGRDGTACVRRTVSGNESSYQSLHDGRAARLVVVSQDLRTAFCGDDSYSDVYRLPECLALEEIPCPPGRCPDPR